MGMLTAQAAQPISQQQPAPQGKGAAAMAPGTYDPNASMNGIAAMAPGTYNPAASMNGIRSQVEPTQNAAVAQIDSTMSGVYNQPKNGPSFNQAMGKGAGQSGAGKSGGQQYMGKPNEFTMSNTTNSATSGQPRMGQSNPYPNTIQPWDNANIQPQTKSGKGKGH
jgi:hypothetical protein